MQLSVNDAKKIAKKNYPDGKFKSVVLYNGLYVLKIFNDDPYEGQMDPFFSVNPKTGEFKEFSVVSGNVDMKELAKLFKVAEGK